MEPEITTKHLQGISDLTLVAPIKQDLINALDTRTYASRLRAVLRTLHTLRQASREHSLVRPFSDSTDRIRTITDLRMAIHEPEQKLLLSVSFDRPWEPYLRIIWRDVGTLLDVIFCNCDTYVTSFDHSFAQYGKWIRGARTNVQFFYKPSALTFDDAQYLRQIEKRQREAAASELELAKLIVPDPEEIARKTALAFLPHTARQGLQALSVLYRLVDFYQGDPDSGILLRASRQLLRELMLISRGLDGRVRDRFAAQLAWFEPPQGPPQAPPQAPATPALGDTREVQGGILTPHDPGITHGCLLLLSVPDPRVAAGFLATLKGMVSTEGATRPKDGIFVNAAFTPQGLRALGLSDAEMAAFPHDFCEGMQERAGLIGDVRGNHPRNWALPERNWPKPIVEPATGNVALVQLSTVHIVVHMYLESGEKGHALLDPLRQKVKQLSDDHPDVQLLSVQPMRRYDVDRARGTTREHFGFVDEISQPVIGARPADDKWSNMVGPGELLLGYENDRGDVPEPNELLDDGSFLVIRKLRQDVAALNKAIAASGIASDEIKARMMGRKVDGAPLVPPRPGKEFDYEDDKDASLCPFAAHIRRANPRTKINKLDGRPTVPRIMRRGMSYGPRFEEDETAERGMMFMAYNTSIAEQFEFIQRWISGGNSTGVLSEQDDPLIGVPQLGETRVFRYHDGADIKRVKLDDATDNPSIPFVRLEWGVYLFAPSRAALGRLERIARRAGRPARPAPAVIKQGEAIIARLRLAKADAKVWKAMLEDSHARASGESEAVWAAIRELHNGVLRTPYGVLVASHALVMKVLRDAKREYSVSGYSKRLKDSIGENYLGLDDGGAGSEYRKQSAVANRAIMAIDEKDAFTLARSHAKVLLSGFIEGAKDHARQARPPEKTWELTFDIKELSDYTLARLCEEWIGPLKDNKRFQPGGWRWDWKDTEPPLYPGHFTAPSRYVFQPVPGDAPKKYGMQHGKAVLEAMKLYVADNEKNPPDTKLGKPIFTDPELRAGDLRARTLVGVMIGMLPTVDGNLRTTLNEWLGGGTLRLTLNEKLDQWTFWDLQNALISDQGTDWHAKALKYLEKPLMRAIQLRPVPELVWRSVTKAHKLGNVKVARGNRIVVASVSATHEALAADKPPDVFPAFGGDRSQAKHPTHACPGYRIAMGVLLGMISALMEMGPVRPTPAPLTLSLRGTMP